MRSISSELYTRLSLIFGLSRSCRRRARRSASLILPSQSRLLLPPDLLKAGYALRLLTRNASWPLEWVRARITLLCVQLAP